MSEPQSSESKKKRRKKKAKRELRVIGWRARVDLPDFGLEGVQVKVDTGARTSSLHATHIRHFTKDGAEWVRFRVHTGKRGARVHTAVDEAINAIRSGAIEARSAMNGVGLVRLMGRQSGFIATHASLASGEVDVCLIPEIDTPLDGPGGESFGSSSDLS